MKKRPRRRVFTAAMCLVVAGCGLPPIVDGARFLVLVESGVDVAQVDFPDQRRCVAAQHDDVAGTARCRRTTVWNALPVAAEADLSDLTRVDAHFLSMSQCERPGVLSRIGATVRLPCMAKR